ncbi:MAG: DinB family protein [Ferruginibacter sp.]
MKEVLKQYAAYTIWANQKIFDCMSNLSDEQINQEITSSFPSLSKTILHMWNAEAIWWQRLKLEEKIIVPGDNFTGSFTELIKQVNQQSIIWKEWVDNATETQLQHVFFYRNTKREEFKQPVYELLLHIMNHGTYHRGQLVTMLRQLGVDKIPSTDFTTFCRKK